MRFHVSTAAFALFAFLKASSAIPTDAAPSQINQNSEVALAHCQPGVIYSYEQIVNDLDYPYKEIAAQYCRDRRKAGLKDGGCTWCDHPDGLGCVCLPKTCQRALFMCKNSEDWYEVQGTMGKPHGV